MRSKRIPSTTAVLFALAALASSLVRVSALPVSPYIMVVPEKTLDSALTPGSTYTITVYTNYPGSDIWSWEFGLEFNPAVLRGTGLANGDLITTVKNPTATFQPGTFDNTKGTLSVTYAFFDYGITTSGPGTFASVSFDVIGYGSSDITLVASKTKLIDETGGPPYIIDGLVGWEQIGNGFFSNKLIGDVNGNRQVDAYDLHKLGKAYGSAAGPPASPNWNSDCDVNHDFFVNGTDLSGLRSNYGKSI